MRWTVRPASPDNSSAPPARPRRHGRCPPRFTNGVEVTVNDVVILDSRRHPDANRPDRNTPHIAVIPASVLRDGDNAISIRLFIGAR